MKLTAQYHAFRTILLKEIKRFMRIWVQTVLPAGITMALYFIIFGNLIGSQLADIKGYRYIDYIVPGIILMAVINNSYANVVASFFNSKFQRHIEEMLISPMPSHLIIVGYVSGGVARGMVVGTVVTLVSTFFVDLHVSNFLLAVLVLILTAVLFALAGFINAVYARSFDDISIIPTFVLTPLTYLGGVFYSIEMLPPFWQSVSLGNPILYMVNAMRYGVLGVSDINIYTAISIILIFITVLYILAWQLLKRGIGVRS